MFDQFFKHKFGHPNAPKLLLSNFSIAGAWLTATCFKVAQAMHPCIVRWMPRKEWTINKIEHCWSLLESHADHSPSLGQQQPSPARSAKLHRPELGASRPEMCKWHDIYTWEVAASVDFEHESCMNVSELTLPQEREKNDHRKRINYQSYWFIMIYIMPIPSDTLPKCGNEFGWLA